MRKSQCPACGSVALEHDASLGSTVCIGCGFVTEESAIVSDISFLEASNGAQKVSGSFVGANATGHRVTGPSGRSSGMESSEMTKQRSLAMLRNYQQPFSLPDSVITTAERHLTLAYEYSFTKGRHIEHVIAVCLYMGCKEAKTSHMLIDFADLLRINVFALGSTYLKWMKTLNLPNTFIEPSVYISRFVAMLEFGDDQAKVALDATRIAARFKEDWIHEGRRTSGICGASIYLAAKMNNYRRSIQEIVQVVKIADTTIIKRLEEFSATSSANLTVGDFRTTENFTVVADPPSFTKARIREKEEIEGPGAGRAAKRRRKRSRTEMEGEDSDESPSERGSPAPNDPLFYPNQRGSNDAASVAIESGSILDGVIPTTSSNGQAPPPSQESQTPQAAKSKAAELEVDQSQVDEVQNILNSEAGQRELALVQTTAESRRVEENAVAPVVAEDDLNDLDEEELDGYICGDEEAFIKERVWTELNLDYLKKLAAKRIQDQTGEDMRAKKPKRKAKKKEAFTPGKTAFESVQAMMQTSKKFSKRINYNVLKTAFPDTMDEKEDDEEDEKLDEKADEYMDDDMKEFRRMRGEQYDEEMDYYEQEA